jgi:hypothetical protein
MTAAAFHNPLHRLDNRLMGIDNISDMRKRVSRLFPKCKDWNE